MVALHPLNDRDHRIGSRPGVPSRNQHLAGGGIRGVHGLLQPPALLKVQDFTEHFPGDSQRLFPATSESIRIDDEKPYPSG